MHGPQPPVQSEVTYEEGGDHLSAAVGHEACVKQLPHVGVDEGVARL